MLYWAGFGFVFLGLLGARLATNAQPTIAATGSELLSPQRDPHARISSTYVVLRAHTDARGNHTLTLQASDWTQLSLWIPSTVATVCPSPGDTIAATAHLISPGLLAIAHRDDLKLLTPGTAGYERQTLTAYVHPTGNTARGGMFASLYAEGDEWLTSASILPSVAGRIRPHTLTQLYGYYTPDHTFVVEDVR